MCILDNTYNVHQLSQNKENHKTVKIQNLLTSSWVDIYFLNLNFQAHKQGKVFELRSRESHVIGS